MHAITFAYTRQPENKRMTITDFHHKVRESILNAPPVSLPESDKITHNIYNNTTHIDPIMKSHFMHSFIDAQKGKVQLGFRETARVQGDLSFSEKIKTYVKDVAEKYKNKASSLNFSKLEKVLSKEHSDPVNKVNHKLQP